MNLLPAPRQNPLAPAWRLPSFERPYAVRRFVTEDTFTVAAGTLAPRNLIQMDGDADMIVDEISFGRQAALPGRIQARFQTGDGLRMSYDLLMCEEIEGPLFPPLALKARSRMYVDLQNSGLASIDVQVQLKGWKQYQAIDSNPCVDGFAPEEYLPLWRRYSSPAAGQHDEAFDYYFELPATSGQVQLAQPLPLEDDAVFLWRGSCGLSDGAGAQKVILYDPFGNKLASDYVLQDNAFGQANQARPQFPEVVCPPGSFPAIDASEYLAASTTLRFVLRGVKRIQD